MGLEDRQGKYDVEQNRSRPAENKSGGSASSAKAANDAAIKAQQEQTRYALKKNFGK